MEVITIGFSLKNHMIQFSIISMTFPSEFVRISALGDGMTANGGGIGFRCRCLITDK
jgi:hypothetical protein